MKLLLPPNTWSLSVALGISDNIWSGGQEEQQLSVATNVCNTLYILCINALHV